MNVVTEHEVDVVIVGGGVAGLWALNRLVSLGYKVFLVESHALGTGQTIASQGIIHGGIKYALRGQTTDASEAIAAMPGIFRACVEGVGEVDLRDVRIHTKHQLLWSVSGLGGRLATFLAGRLARARATAVAPNERRAPFDHPDFRGRLYQLDEPVIDAQSLIRQLARDHLASLFSGVVQRPEPSDRPDRTWVVPVQHPDEPETAMRVHTKHVILAAGAGNADLIAMMGVMKPGIDMQRRPLHMVMARSTQLPVDLYGHCLGTSSLPRLTITSHRDAHQRTVWYMGGEIAERGVGRSIADQVDHGRRELRSVLPWISQDHIEWSSFHIDRAEPRTRTGSRPDLPFVKTVDDVTVVWPTKLAFAPRLAADIVATVTASLKPSPDSSTPAGEELKAWPCPDVAVCPWDEESRTWIR